MGAVCVRLRWTQHPRRYVQVPHRDPPRRPKLRCHGAHRTLASRPIMLAVFVNQDTGTPLTHCPRSAQPTFEALWDIFRFGRNPKADDSDIIAGGIIRQSMALAREVFMSLLRKDMQAVAAVHWEASKAAMERMAEEMEGWKFGVRAYGVHGDGASRNEEGGYGCGGSGGKSSVGFKIVGGGRRVSGGGGVLFARGYEGGEGEEE